MYGTDKINIEMLKVNKGSNSENLVWYFHADNMVQEDNMGWNRMTRRKLHTTD